MKHKKTITGLMILLSIVSVSCVAAPPPQQGSLSLTEQPPPGVELVMFKPPPLGTQVEWDIVNRYGKEFTDKGVLSKKEFDGKVGYFWKNPAYKTNSIYDLEAMNWVGKWSHEREAWVATAKPSSLRFQYPLWPGKSYKVEYTRWEKGGLSFKVKKTINIGDWETITVPAGTFKTLKITQIRKIHTIESWFAPELGMGVKFIKKSKKGIRRGELINVVRP